MTLCVVLVPVLNRPHRVVPFLEALAASEADARPLFICSPDDELEQKAVADAGADMIVLDQPPTRGDYARKINAGYYATAEALLFLGADDVHFHRRWLQRCVRRLDQPGIHVVGTNDLCNQRVMNGQHSTHSLVTRTYVAERGTIDERGKVLHEGYPHEFVDDEFIETAKTRDAFAFARDAMVEHLHPMAGKAPMDALYAEQSARMRIGRKIYTRRRRLWT